MLDELLNAAGALPDREWGHRFGCPPAGPAARLNVATSKSCHLKDKTGVTRYCKDQRYGKPQGKLLRIVGLLPRCSDEWKTEYKKRTTMERHFSSVKHSRLMNRRRNFNIIQRFSTHAISVTDVPSSPREPSPHVWPVVTHPLSQLLWQNAVHE